MHKYRATKTEVDGFIFPSKLEADTYRALRDIHNCGAVQNLRLQVPYILHGANGSKVCTYQLDFLIELHDGSCIAFESKGVMTRIASLKLKLFAAEYGIPLVVITSSNLSTLKSIAAIVKTTVQSYRPMAFMSEVAENLQAPRKRKAKSKSKKSA